MTTRFFNYWVGGFFSWLWEWIKCLSYWIAAIGGIGSFVIYLVTKDRRFVTFTAAIILIYIMVAATGGTL